MYLQEEDCVYYEGPQKSHRIVLKWDKVISAHITGVK